MPVKDGKQQTTEAVETVTISKAEYDQLKADLKKFQEAVGKLLNAMGQRYISDLAKEVLGE